MFHQLLDTNVTLRVYTPNLPHVLITLNPVHVLHTFARFQLPTLLFGSLTPKGAEHATTNSQTLLLQLPRKSVAQML